MRTVILFFSIHHLLRRLTVLVTHVTHAGARISMRDADITTPCARLLYDRY